MKTRLQEFHVNGDDSAILMIRKYEKMLMRELSIKVTICKAVNHYRSKNGLHYGLWLTPNTKHIL